MPGVFINYRGEDSQLAAALIDRELTARFGTGKVFLDCRSIPVGADFEKELLGRLRSCNVLLVVIGPRWLTLTDEMGRRRIDDPRDWLRREIVAAFVGDLRVIPVLIDQGRLPSAAELPEDIAGLARRQYVQLRRRYPRADLEYLVQRITEVDDSLAEAAAKPDRHDGATPTTPSGDPGFHTAHVVNNASGVFQGNLIQSRDLTISGDLILGPLERPRRDG